MWLVRPWLWLFRRKPKELLLPAVTSVEKVEEPQPPAETPEFLPYTIGNGQTAAPVVPPEGRDEFATLVLPPIEVDAKPASPLPVPEEGSVIALSDGHPPLTPVAPRQAAKYSESWIRDRAGYFSAGRYAPSLDGARRFLAPDLLFRLGIDGQRSLPERTPAPPAKPVPPIAAKPAPRLMDDFTTSPASGPPSPDPQGRVVSVDPLLLTFFFTAREGDPGISGQATSEYLTEPTLLANAIRLRDRLLQHWTAGGGAVSAQQLYDLALQFAQHPGTALLLCHNVAKAFARGGDAIRWQVINRATGEYSDGESMYRAIGWQAAFAAPSMFYALFAANEFGMSDAGRWYRFFACATAACYAAAGQTRVPVLAPTPEIERVARQIVDIGQKMRDATLELTPAYQGWLWVNAWVFVETAAYSRNQQAAHAESLNGLRGACFGLVQVGRAPEPRWRWGVPRAGGASGPTSDAIVEWLNQDQGC